MSSKANIKELFENWNKYNQEVQELMGNFDLANVKKIRKKQQEIEDNIYNLLKKSAPKEYLKMLPEDCGELEVGYDTTNNEFYFVMIDEEDSTEEEMKLNAITIDMNKKIDLIENFEIE